MEKKKREIADKLFSIFYYDGTILLPLLVLTGIGVVMIYSASSATALTQWNDAMFFLKKQSVFAISGIILFGILSAIDYRIFKKCAYLLLIISLAFLMGVYIPELGVKVGGSLRWLNIGGFRFQPAEAARFSFIIYLAYSLSKKEDHIKEFLIGFLPHIIVLGVFVTLIIFQPDFGAAIILIIITGIMMFIAGVKIWQLAGAFVLFIPVLWYIMMRAPYRVDRLVSFFDPWQHAQDSGYQIIHSLMAFGTGGIWGTGLGNGVQKLFYLPESHTDFIFSVIGEETGLWGVALILFLYSVIIIKGTIIAKNEKDRFGSYLAAGITISIALQVCINTGVTLGLLPAKGLTLPLLSYGGTSLLVNTASLGILANIGKNKDRAARVEHRVRSFSF